MVSIHAATPSFTLHFSDRTNPSQPLSLRRKHFQASTRPLLTGFPVGNRHVVRPESRSHFPAVRSAIKNVLDHRNAVESHSATISSAIFSQEDWKKHESSSRYFTHIKTMFNSSVISSVALPVALVAAIACAVVGWNTLIVRGYLPIWAKILHTSSLPFTLTTPALSLLLIFRTNSAYARFDEARKMIGLMLNRIRDVGRQALTYMARNQHTHEYPKRNQLLRHLQALPLIYKHHFLQEGSLEADLRGLTLLREHEVQNLLRSSHRLNYCLHVMSECMGRCHMEPSSRLSMEQNFATFADTIGGSERLFRTPIPLSYTRLTSRFLITYHLFLPLALYDTLGFLTVPATILHALAFFCIDEVGVLIENPFPALALDAIAKSARDSIAEMISVHAQVRHQVTEDEVDVSSPLPLHAREEFQSGLAKLWGAKDVAVPK